MAYDVGKLVRADSSLNMAVGNALRIDEKAGKDIRTRIQRNSMMESGEPIATEEVSGYNSYFKIVDASETAEDGTLKHKISIVDGHGRGINRCKVNNKVFDLPEFTSENLSSGTYIISLRYATNKYTVEYKVEESTDLPNDTAEYSWYQIGTVSVSDVAITIHQDHLTGVAQMFWYDLCGD